MTELFLDVLNISFSAIWMVLGVVLARLLLKKAPRWMVCSLWVLVALRLVLGGIEAPFSLVPSTQLIPPESLYDQSPAIHSGISSIDNAINPVYSELLRPCPGASVNPLQVWLAVAANLWVLGMGVMVLWALCSCVRVRKLVRESVPSDGVFLCDRISSPFIFGLFRPKIYLPSDLDEASKTHVIAHERAHLARRDHWWKPLGFALLSVNWFNPALWLAYILLCRDIELACDEKVIRTFTAEEKKAYSSALLTCSVNGRHISACPLAFGEVGVKQRIKSVLHYKRPAFWVILAAVILVVILAVGLLTDPASRSSEILYNGCLYELFNRDYSFVPTQEPVATLRSILHNTDEHPSEELQGTNLDESLSGCPLYLEGENLYLVKFDGSCMAFRRVLPHGFLNRTLTKDLDFVVYARGTHVDEWESLPDDWARELRSVLPQLQTADFEPIHDEPQGADLLHIYFYQDSLTCSLDLTLREDGFWYLHFFDEELGAGQLWRLRCEALYNWAEPYMDRVSYYDTIFADQAATIVYHTFTKNTLALKLGIPMGWMVEELTTPAEAAGFRFQPEGRTGWVNVRLYPEEVRLDLQTNTPSPMDFPNGTTAMIHSLYADRWETMQLDTIRGTLLADMDREVDWWADLGSTAEAILGSLQAYDQGEAILGKPNTLGINLRVTDVTSRGATLVCTQEGGIWGQISTGAPWSLEQWTENGWVMLTPEETVWTSIAYLVNLNSTTKWNLNWSLIVGEIGPGRYRVGKSFCGDPQFSIPQLKTGDLRQTYYAEFTISANGIAISDQMQQAVMDDWRSYEAKSWMDRMLSSKTPGSCTRSFDNWADAEEFIGLALPNPLENLEMLEKGNWAAMPVGYNGGSRFYLSWSGTREGDVQWAQIQSGYRYGTLRVSETISLQPSSTTAQDDANPIITTDAGEAYEARTATLSRGHLHYSIRVMGDPGTGDQLAALLDTLLPYFEEISA